MKNPHPHIYINVNMGVWILQLFLSLQKFESFTSDTVMLLFLV